MRGEREDGGKRAKTREGNIFFIFEKMKEGERGDTHRREGRREIYGQTSRLRTRSTGDDPPDGDRTEGVGMEGGAGAGVG